MLDPTDVTLYFLVIGVQLAGPGPLYNGTISRWFSPYRAVFPRQDKTIDVAHNCAVYNTPSTLSRCLRVMPCANTATTTTLLHPTVT